MVNIGGNLSALFQIRADNEKNEIGETMPAWKDGLSVPGWLDLSTGDSKHTTFSAKIQESTHIFICDYKALPNITAENSRLIIDNQIYEILLIDNPMNMNEHLEIYLKYIGGQNGG